MAEKLRLICLVHHVLKFEPERRFHHEPMLLYHNDIMDEANMLDLHLATAGFHLKTHLYNSLGTPINYLLSAHEKLCQDLIDSNLLQYFGYFASVKLKDWYRRFSSPTF